MMPEDRTIEDTFGLVLGHDFENVPPALTNAGCSAAVSGTNPHNVYVESARMK